MIFEEGLCPLIRVSGTVDAYQYFGSVLVFGEHIADSKDLDKGSL